MKIKYIPINDIKKSIIDPFIWIPLWIKSAERVGISGSSTISIHELSNHRPIAKIKTMNVENEIARNCLKVLDLNLLDVIAIIIADAGVAGSQ